MFLQRIYDILVVIRHYVQLMAERQAMAQHDDLKAATEKAVQTMEKMAQWIKDHPAAAADPNAALLTAQAGDTIAQLNAASDAALSDIPVSQDTPTVTGAASGTPAAG